MLSLALEGRRGSVQKNLSWVSPAWQRSAGPGDYSVAHTAPSLGTSNFCRGRQQSPGQLPQDIADTPSCAHTPSLPHHSITHVLAHSWIHSLRHTVTHTDVLTYTLRCSHHTIIHLHTQRLHTHTHTLRHTVAHAVTDKHTQSGCLLLLLCSLVP